MVFKQRRIPSSIFTSILILWMYNNNFATGNVSCPPIKTDSTVKVAYDEGMTRAKFDCIKRWYEMVGNNEEKTSYCSLGTWYPAAPRCIIQCRTPSDPKNGKANYKGLKPGSTLTYKCNDGFGLSETETRVCTRFGMWGGKVPVCVATACEKPTNPDNGRALYDSLVKIGSKLNYICDEGFILDPDEERTCTSEGKWSGEEPLCKEIVCNDPIKPKGGRVELTSGDTKVGSTVKFSCNSGNTLFGSVFAKCTRNGEWDSETPMCIKNCDPPPSVQNAIFSKPPREPYSINTNVSYECDAGYVGGSGNPQSVCEIHNETKKSVWTKPDITCVPISCGNPGNIDNGRREGDDFTYPNSVRFVCSEGYRLVGKSILHCQASGEWNDKVPSCKGLLCDIPLSPHKGTALFNSVEFGSKVKYVCDEGFMLNQEEERTCLSNGLWSGQDPKCEAVMCKYPEVPIDGNVQFSGDGRGYGSIAFFGCDFGKTLIGSNSSTCLNTGQWSSDSPLCLDSCTVSVIQNGNLGVFDELGSQAYTQEITIGSTVDHGRELLLNCSQGYEPEERSGTKVTCEDGEWSSELRCIPAHCPDAPPIVVNGDVVKYEKLHDSIALYECDKNYKLVDKGIVVCKYGTWKGKLPVCEDTRCYTRSLRNISGLVIGQNDFLASGESFTPSCSDTYEISNENGGKIYCREGEWTGNIAPCTERRVCASLEAPDGGNIEMIGGQGTIGSSAVFTCNPGRKLVGESTSKCTGTGEWTSAIPKCLKPCTVPLILHGSLSKTAANGSFIYFQETSKGTSIEPGTELLFRCHRKYYLPNFNSTEFKVTCDNGQLPSDLQCVPENCPDAPPPIMNGYIEHFEDKHNGIVIYKCNELYVFEDVGSISCDFGIWKGKLPVCKYTRCYMRSLSNTPGLLIDQKKIFDSGQSFTPQCSDSYEVSKQGDGKIYCDAGKWTGNIPPCEETSCTEAPPEPENGRAIRYTGANGTVVVYKCDDSYIMEQNSKVECLYRKWEGTPPICKDTRCHMKDLSKYPGIVLDETKFILNGQSFTPSCISGYQISWNDNARIQCNKGEWTGNLPPCKEETCSVPFVPNGSTGEDVKNGRFVNFKKVPEGTSVEHGTQLTFRCDAKYEVLNMQNAEPKITCDKGKWSPDLQCTPAPCRSAPPALLNGFVEKSEVTHNGAVSYKCNEFYKRNDKGSVVCQFGSWKGSLPTCVDTRCYTKSLTDMAGLSKEALNQREFFSSGGSFTPICTEMYEVSKQDDTNIYCRDGEWSGNLPPCTEKIVCSDPEVPVGGSVEVIGGKRTVGSSAVFTCNPGRKLDGFSTSKCLDTGSWSSATPQCLKPCTVPLVQYGSFGYERPKSLIYFQEIAAQTNVEPGTELLFRCERNYVIANQENSELKVTCQNEKLPSDLKCIPAKCRDAPPPLSNGFIEKFEDIHEGKVIYKCNEFFKLVDNGLMECQFGSWKGKLPTCKEIRCYMNTLSEVPGLVINPKKILNNGESFLPKCSEMYEVSNQGDGKIYCTDGEWTGNIPPCEEKGCKEPPPQPINGEAIEYTGLHGTTVTYSCNLWHKIEGDYKVECLNRQWKGTPPICKETRCFMSSLSEYPGILINQQDFALSGQSFTPKCDDGYVIVGKNDVRIYCTEGLWSGNLPPCKEADCVDPPPEPENGRATVYTEKHGSSVTYECNEHFYLEVANSNVECFLGKWRGDIPLCKDTRCYLKDLRNNDGIQLDNDSPTMPNEMALVTCEEGYIRTFSPPTCLRGEWKTANRGRFSPCQQAGCKVEAIENGETKSLRRNVKERPNVKLEEDDFFTIDVESWKSGGDTVYVFCQLPYTFNGKGDPGYTKISCQKGKWSPTPRCLLNEISTTTVLIPNTTCECVFNSFGGFLEGRLDERQLNYGDKISSGSSITFRCTDPDSYRLTGPREIRCENCEWDSAFPACEELKSRLLCPEIPKTESIIVQYSRNREIGSEAKFWCMKIESQKIGPEKITCLPTGQWSTQPPTCIDKLCPEIAELSSMIITYEGNREINSIARFQCKLPESQRVGPHFITCESNGQWSGRPPTCIGFCPAFEENESLIITYHGERRINSTVSFSCQDPELQRVGPAFVTCLPSGQWSDNLPECEEIICPELNVDNSVQVTYNGERKIHSTASFTCIDADKDIIGPDTLSCLQDGKWSEEPPTCKYLFCPEIVIDNSVQVTYNDERKIHTTASFICTNPDTEIVGPVTLSCLQNGKWSKKPPICEQLFCPEIVTENSVQITYNGERKIYSTASFQCLDPNTEIVGPVMASCLQDGKWSTEPPSCKKLFCPEIVTENSVHITYNGDRKISSTASFQCPDPNTEIVGPVMASCLQDGKWSTEPPTCKIVFCPEIPVANSVKVTYNADRKIYSTASFRCVNSDSQINGPQQVSCEITGKWSEKPPTCEYLFCPDIEVSDEVEVIYNSGKEIFSTASFRCASSEAEIVGPSSVSCQQTGKWSENPPTCKKSYCPELRVENSVIVSYSSGRRISSVGRFRCSKYNAEIVGPNTITCLSSGEWSNNPPTCRTKQNICPEIATDDTVTVTYSGNRQRFSRAEFRCSDPDKAIVGFVTVTCLLTGEWSGLPPTCKTKNQCENPPCERPDTTPIPSQTQRNELQDFLCPEIAADDLVIVTYTSNRRLYSKAEFRCLDPDMVVTGFVTVSCLATGKWSGSSPTCTISECGPDAVTCQDGSCVENSKRCDSVSDCPDGRDEDQCEGECPEILPRKEMTISYNPNRRIHGKASFRCKSPWKRIGAATITCRYTKKWSRPVPSCHSHSQVCSVRSLMDQKKSFMKLSDEKQTNDLVLLESEIHLKCEQTGTDALKSAKAICKGNDLWEIGTCISGCVPFKKSQKSSLIINNQRSSYSLGDHVTFSCPEGKALTSALQRAVCLNGGWSHTDLPDCEDIDDGWV